MRLFLRSILLSLLFGAAAHAQSLVYCISGTTTVCSSSAQVGTGTSGDPLWKAFGKIDDNFSNPSWLSTYLGTYLASPAGIGGTVSAAGAFTTLSATGLITPSTAAGVKGTAIADSAQAGSVGELQTVSCGGDSTATVTFTSASPTVVTWSSHPFLASGPTNWECPINFSTSSAAPTGITVGTNYYIVGSSLSGDTFNIADTAAHALAGTNKINTSDTGTGTQTGWMGALGTNLTVYGAAGISLTAGDWDCNVLSVFSAVTALTATAFWQGVNTSAGSLPAQGSYTQFRFPSGSIGAADEMPPGFPVRQNISSTTTVYGVTESAFSGGSQNESAFLRCRRMR